MALAATNPITAQPYSKGILDRFWSKVEKTDTCWHGVHSNTVRSIVRGRTWKVTK